MKYVKMIVLGDSHIPDRALEIPRKILEDIEKNRPYDIAIFTGDFTCEEVYEWFKGLGRKVYAVEGNMDYIELPEYVVLTLNSIKMGVIHGSQVYPRGNIVKLTHIAQRLGVKILLSGHTHKPFLKKYKGVLHLNPGSITGVWSGSGSSFNPTYAILYISYPVLGIKFKILRSENDIVEKVFRINLERLT